MMVFQTKYNICPVFCCCMCKHLCACAVVCINLMLVLIVLLLITYDLFRQLYPNLHFRNSPVISAHHFYSHHYDHPSFIPDYKHAFSQVIPIVESALLLPSRITKLFVGFLTDHISCLVLLFVNLFFCSFLCSKQHWMLVRFQAHVLNVQNIKFFLHSNSKWTNICNNR